MTSGGYVLHNYFRSSTSLRVRMALAIKQIDYDYSAYSLLDNEHRDNSYLALNPEGLVPALQTPDGVISQSMAILEYLDESHPAPALLPADAAGRARVRSLAHVVALDIHPINNLRILQYLRREFHADDMAVSTWFRHWADTGFKALEVRLSSDEQTGVFCHGDQMTLADICLVSQAVNNRRFDLPLESYPTIQRIVTHCLDLPVVQQALPDRQPDSPAG